MAGWPTRRRADAQGSSSARATRAVGAIASDGRRFPTRKQQDAAMAAVSLIVSRPGLRALTAIAGGNAGHQGRR